eukprot:15197-Heterococcus_DN1.PRE.2
MTPAHQCSAACSSASVHEVELLRQQLVLKDALLREIRDAKDAEDAVIASKEAVIAELRASKAASSSEAAQLESPELGTGAAPSAEQLAATEVRLQRLEAALSTSSNSASCAGSSSSSSSVVLLVHQQKRARCLLHPAKPLEKDEVLDEIFSYVGRKEWLYAGGVCRRWRGRYLSMCYKARASKEEHAFQTRHNSTFTTAARFLMALDNGLQLPNEGTIHELFDDLPRFSQQPIEVLTLARVHGVAWHIGMCSDAVYYGDFELLKWLHKSGCPWDAPLVADNAIRGKRGQHELILPWLLSVEAHWPQADKMLVVFQAGVMCDLVALELMIAAGAEWPSNFVGEHTVHRQSSVRTCWDYRAVAWALEKGCSWGVWRCQELAPELYVGEENRAFAVRLFEWAHENDCPCTCEAAAADGTVVV